MQILRCQLVKPFRPTALFRLITAQGKFCDQEATAGDCEVVLGLGFLRETLNKAMFSIFLDC